MQDEKEIYIDLRKNPRAGRRALFNATAPDGSPGCRVVAVVSRANHEKWESYKHFLAVKYPGVVFTNDRALNHLIESIEL